MCFVSRKTHTESKCPLPLKAPHVMSPDAIYQHRNPLLPSMWALIIEPYMPRPGQNRNALHCVQHNFLSHIIVKATILSQTCNSLCKFKASARTCSPKTIIFYHFVSMCAVNIFHKWINHLVIPWTGINPIEIWIKMKLFPLKTSIWKCNVRRQTSFDGYMGFLVMRMSQVVFAAAEGVAIYNERF